MIVTTGRVRDGVVRTEGDPLPEGIGVTILVAEIEDGVVLGEAEEEKLLAAIEECRRGESIPVTELLQKLAKS